MRKIKILGIKKRQHDGIKVSYKVEVMDDAQQQIEHVKAKPEHLPKPTYWPFFLALGLAFLGWGLLSHWLISLAGLIVFVIALIGWINNMRYER